MNPLKMKSLAAWIVSVGAWVVLTGGSPLLAAQSSAPDGGPPVQVSGVVTDGSGQGWPLYARIEITSASTPPAVVFSDPVTGAYAMDLADGIAYTFVVTAQSPGYVPGGGPITTSGSPIVADWQLSVDGVCGAPGYQETGFDAALSEGFDSGTIPAGWSVDTVSGASWQVYTGGDPCGAFPGNQTGGSGPYAVLNSNCDSNFFETDDSFLVTPSVDLSSSPSAAIRWANDFVDLGLGTLGDVDVSVDGGMSWATVWHAPGDLPGPNTQTADMSFAAGHADVRARFHYQAFWAWWWQVDDVLVGHALCAPLPGGLVVGTVSDANTGLGLVGATVTNLSDNSSTTTFATPEDPNQDDGLYVLFAGTGPQSFEASLPAYESLTKDAMVVAGETVPLDFSLASGLLDASPRPLSLFAAPGGTQDLMLTMTNAGTGDGSFVIREVDAAPPPAPTRPASLVSARDRSAALRHRSFGQLAASAPTDLPRVEAPSNVPALAGAGGVVGTFPSGLSGGWGLAYDTDAGKLWVSNPDAAFFGLPGDGFEYEYLPDGTQTGETIDIHDTGGSWQADGTYNARTGMIWQVNVGSDNNVGADNCLFELDPVAKVVTGKKICGSWTAVSQRGVAYDYVTDTYYVGGWNERVVYHIDNAGNILDSHLTDFYISGLAYNPSTRHLFVGVFASLPFDVWVMDTANDYAVIGGFPVRSGGVNVLNGQGVSLEADCDGHLWIYDVFGQVVYEVASGESGWCVNDIPWLSENPTSGTIPGSGGGGRPSGAGNSLPVTVTFDSTGLLPGLRQGQLVFTTDTPTPVAPVPVDYTVLFNDVPQGSFAWNFIYGAAGAGVMPGCAPQAPGFDFCPADVVTRRSMAGFIERAVHGALTPPPVYVGEFDDVLLGSFNSDYIQGLVNDAITAGCSVSPDGGFRVEGPARIDGSAGLHGHLQRRTVSERVRGGLHRGHLQRGRHGRLRGRQLLPGRGHHERPDGGVPGEGVQHPVPAVGAVGRGAGPPGAGQRSPR
jgi:hypothetical protein